MKKLKGLDCILLVDDDAPTNYIHQLMIKKSDIDVHVQVTNTAMEALDFLTANGKYSGHSELPKPGIIFLDINMPGMNGWEFLEEYRHLKAESKAKIIVVMLTTSLNPDDKERAAKHTEIDVFLNKPLKKEVIEQLTAKYFPES